MAKLYPTIYASVLCLALIFVHTAAYSFSSPEDLLGESLDCRRTASAEATATRKACIQSGTGGCGQAYTNTFLLHQRTCSFQVGRRSGDLATFLGDTNAQDSPAIENWRSTKDDKFNSLMNRLRNVAEDVEDDLPRWLQEAEEADLDSPHVVPHDSIQRLLARL
eukprot:XP_011662627.1 PREDICTED: uncharacterized protein LOC105437575 isoform X1 [Strongylocentrotus purpuratus]